MTAVTTAPYGTWTSPVGAAVAAAHDGLPEYLGAVGDEVWWTEPRPAESGRRTLVRRRADGETDEPLPAPWDVRSRVIEYGGRPWDAAADDRGPLIVFVHFADQRLYAYQPEVPGAGPRPLTPLSPVGGGLRWADLEIDRLRGEVRCVLEEFTGDLPTDVRRAIAAVPLDGSGAEDRTAVRELAPETHRFVTGPRISPDGRHAVWLAWDHPHLPWDAAELKLAQVADDGRFQAVVTLLGGPGDAVAQAEWSPDGTVLAATDRSGWWNLYRVDPRTGKAVNLRPAEEEFAGPLWRLGYRWFAPLPDGLVAVLHGRGAQRLAVLDPTTGELADAPGHWTEWQPFLAVCGPVCRPRVTGVAAGPHTSYEVVELDIGTASTRAIGARHRDVVDPAYLPAPVERVFTGPAGRDIHAQLYPPRNPGFRAPPEAAPPYVVWVHGGPTSRAPLVLDLEIAYFTSRGIGVAEVNYGGSTGYGRAYRERLREQWGVVDVEDCAAVARALADEGLADRDRLAIRGGSAGGWTSAASLTAGPAEPTGVAGAVGPAGSAGSAGTAGSAAGVYACATIKYPILDLYAWAAAHQTHDFESHYLESLVGPVAEVPDRYRDRSPVNHTARITVPFLLLQGLADVICPPGQCEAFLTRIAGRGVPHAYLAFEGEGHGFRRKDTIVACLEAELSFYGQVFGFAPPGVRRLELASAVPW